jgi:hypothetical protein
MNLATVRHEHGHKYLKKHLRTNPKIKKNRKFWKKNMGASLLYCPGGIPDKDDMLRDHYRLERLVNRNKRVGNRVGYVIRAPFVYCLTDKDTSILGDMPEDKTVRSGLCSSMNHC